MELHNLYAIQSIIRVIKGRRRRWEGQVACMGKRTVYRILVGCQKERYHQEDLDIKKLNFVA
jgi:hypothetical protein